MPIGNLSNDDCTAVIKHGTRTIYLAPEPNAMAATLADDCLRLNILTAAPDWPDHGGDLPTAGYISRASGLADLIDVEKTHIVICCHSGIFRSAIIAIFLLIRLGMTKSLALETVFKAQGKSNSAAHKSRVGDYFK